MFERKGILFLPEGMPEPGDLASDVRGPAPDDANLLCFKCGKWWQRHEEDNVPGAMTSMFCHGCEDEMQALAKKLEKAGAADGNLPKDVQRTKNHVLPQTGRGLRRRIGRHDNGS